jgi:acetylornithine deacetylase/succinyl-diaminopimelate desuccinylase-like protein
MGEYGFEAELRETATHPLVYAEEIVGEDRPTVLFYGHYDVQPPGEASAWESPPFEPTIRDGSIYARGAGDNKGQLLTHVFAAAAVREHDGELPLNVKFLFEGEEETGSRGLVEFVESSPPELACDLVYVADGPMHPSRSPTTVYGNRGILAAELTLQTAAADLHSGNFGGPVPNAANELLAVLGTLYDGERIEIEGVYDDVAITAADREAISEIPFDAEKMKRDLGVDRFTVPDERYYERLLSEPTLTINGLRSGYGGKGMKTVIPHEATAKLDMRLVPDQDPEEVFEQLSEHVAEEHPDVEVEKQGTLPPMKTALDTPAAGAVREALSDSWGEDRHAAARREPAGGVLPGGERRPDPDRSLREPRSEQSLAERALGRRELREGHRDLRSLPRTLRRGRFGVRTHPRVTWRPAGRATALVSTDSLDPKERNGAANAYRPATTLGRHGTDLPAPRPRFENGRSPRGGIRSRGVAGRYRVREAPRDPARRGRLRLLEQGPVGGRPTEARRGARSLPRSARRPERDRPARRPRPRRVGRYDPGRSLLQRREVLPLDSRWGRLRPRADRRSHRHPVSEYVKDGGFESEHNRAITWQQFL